MFCSYWRRDTILPNPVERHADQLLKANFNPDEPRDWHGRWTTEGADDKDLPSHSAPASVAAHATGRNPRRWEDYPNPDFRNRLAIAEQTADRPNFGYVEVHDSIDRRGRHHLALGRYLMTPLALRAAGLIDRWGHWTGKYGVRSQAELLANPEAQEQALSDYLADNERQLTTDGAYAYLGQAIHGLQDQFMVTRAGIIAAAHRRGAEATR